MSPGRLTSDHGVTTIADRVVAGIASRAAAEIEEAGGAQRSVLGIRMGTARRARARATLDGAMVTARVELSVQYPTSVLTVTRQARERIRDRVESLTGLKVSHIDIDVTTLRPPEPRKVARVR
ncbi:Asp23/Gls24 family envelope stress response protein [Thermomonospora umbrina]|uniref:Putative alkaline shock family protein YloU n=1 Tax=Thermomonospora umbrina TaxID=111806 RepID=A0A3D9T4B4_9ACTN|nr:Asp23/Gls24 family envelope stress response protein [Thermomonospora umbrina]REE98661.1 putative alkaline shock family protein YloU [Thermomonospora umbrina]